MIITEKQHMEVASKLFLRHENPGKCAFEFLDASVSPSWVSDTYIRIRPTEACHSENGSGPGEPHCL